MALEDTMRSLREFDLGDLDFENVGSWPGAIKAIIFLVVIVAVLVAGYYYHIEELQLQLAKVEAFRRRTWMPTASKWWKWKNPSAPW
jgi:type IV pilus assembly protein PilO